MGLLQLIGKRIRYKLGRRDKTGVRQTDEVANGEELVREKQLELQTAFARSTLLEASARSSIATAGAMQTRRHTRAKTNPQRVATWARR